MPNNRAALRLKLTPSFVAKLKADPDRIVAYYDADVPQLMLRVMPSGIRTFNVNFIGRDSKKAGRKSLGTWPALTVEGARHAARQALLQNLESGEPDAVRRRRERRERAAGERVETFGDLVKDYKSYAETEHRASSLANTMCRLNVTFKAWHDRELSKLDAFSIERFKRDRLRDGRAPGTVARDLDCLRSVLSHAVRCKFIDAHPMRGDAVKRLRFDNKRVRFLSADEEQRLRAELAARDVVMRAKRESFNAWRVARRREPLPSIDEGAFGDHLTPLVLVALNTGLRRGELSALVWADIDFARSNLTVRAAAAKGGKRRDVPLNSEAVDVLKRWKSQQSEDAERVFALADAKTALTKVIKAAGIKDFSMHDLRHSFASKLVVRGVDLNMVRELLGHADLKMTLRYAHLAPAHKATAVEKLVEPAQSVRSRVAVS